MPPIQQPPRKPPQDPELRYLKAKQGGNELWDSGGKGPPEEYILHISTQFLGELRKKVLQPQQLLPVDPKALKQIRKAEKAEREFRKKFKVWTPSYPRALGKGGGGLRSVPLTKAPGVGVGGQHSHRSNMPLHSLRGRS